MKSTSTRTLMLIAVVVFATIVVKAHPATGIVVARSGEVFFSDLETVWKIDLQGKLSVFRAGVSGRHVHELAIDDQDNIYGADISYASATQQWISAVWKMTPDGKITYLQEPSVDPAPGISIWQDRAGSMYSVDQNNHTKTQTLLLRRTPEGVVDTLAGSAYGHADGKGDAARFSSVGGIAFGPDGSLYLSDGNSVRKVTLDGYVTTVATGLDFKTADDRSKLFGGAYGDMTGLTVDSSENVYVADAGKRRLLKISKAGKVDIFYRAEPPYFPNGVFATRAGDIFVMEVGFTLPNAWSGPRVRRFSRDGKNILLATVGAETPTTFRASIAQGLGMSVESTLEFVLERFRLLLLVLFTIILATTVFVWRRHRLRQRT